MRKDITLVAEPRSSRGKNEARRLRASGSTPAVVYGTGGETVPVAVNPKEVNRILHSKSGHNTIFNLRVTGGETAPVMIVDWQTDPVKDTLLHADLQRIDLTKERVVKVPVHTAGDPKGVKMQGGAHEIVNREIEIQCLPDDIPEEFTLDVSELLIGQSVRASDIPLSASMKLVSPEDTVISHVVMQRAATTEAEEAEEVEATGEEGEPEVVKKGKKEEEAEEK